MKATISSTSPRRQTWLEVFGTESIEIESPVPHRAQGPDGERQFYKLDVTALTAAQRSRMIRFLSERWKMPVDQVADTVDDPEHGVPIAADDVIVAMDMRLFV